MKFLIALSFFYCFNLYAEDVDLYTYSKTPNVHRAPASVVEESETGEAVKNPTVSKALAQAGEDFDSYMDEKKSEETEESDAAAEEIIED